MKTKSQIVREVAQNEEDRILLARVLDQLETCRARNYQTHTRFLDMRERTLVTQAVRQLDGMGELAFAGGYPDAERVLAVFFPEYMTARDAVKDAPLAFLHAQKRGREPLTHRDYLGALMGLQIERECIGDILVQAQGAHIVVLQEIAEFLMLHFDKAGRQPITLSCMEAEELCVDTAEEAVHEGNVASMRLDSVTAQVFGLSRSEAQAAVAKGVVFLNQLQCLKAEKIVAEGDSITLRGKGRARIAELSGISRKGRQFMRYTRTK